MDPEWKGEAADGVSIRQLPACRVAFTRHHGSLGGVGTTYDRLLQWMEEAGLEVDGPSREVYLTNPLQTGEEELVTEIQIPAKNST